MFLFDAPNAVVRGNRIGVSATGGALGNGRDGVRLVTQWEARAGLVGGTGAGEGNLIAHNGINGIYFNGLGASNNTSAGNTVRDNSGDGIRVQTATGVRITQTQTTRNGFAGIALPSSGNGRSRRTAA